MPIVGIRQCEGRHQGFIAGDQAVACRPVHQVAGSFQRRAVPMRFIAQKRIDLFPMDVRRSLGLEKIRDRQLHQRVPHGRRVEDIRVEKDRVLAHFEP